MQPPEVLQLHVTIVIAAKNCGHAVSRPVRPGVEVVGRSLLETVRPVERQLEPVAEHLFVGARKKAEVVDLEVRGEALVDRLEPRYAAAELAYGDALRVTRQACAVRVLAA